MALIDEALQIVKKTGERWLQAELCRHKAQLLLRCGHSEPAEEFYCKALGIAREQEAKLWELRAQYVSPGCAATRGAAGAHDLLDPVYGWFTKGFDTRDLKEANALLKELDA